MPSPSRVDLDDFYAQLPEAAAGHLRALQRLCREELPEAEEVLHWNQPAFVQDGVRLLALQAYTRHCSLRFPTRQFATQRDAVEAAGYATGEGFIKLPYDRALPLDLLRGLVRARLAEYRATGAGW